MLLPQEEKEEFKMDFIKTSEAYGYETIADAEEKALAAKYKEGIGIGMESGFERGGAEGNCEKPESLRSSHRNYRGRLRLFCGRNPRPVISVSKESLALCGA